MSAKVRIRIKAPESKRENLVFQKRKTNFPQSTSLAIDHIMLLHRTIGNQAGHILHEFVEVIAMEHLEAG